MTPAAAPVLPRGLIFLASLWLVGSWLAAIGIQPPVQPSSASYTPGVRLLLDCIAAGVTVAWPLMRLSQPRCEWPVRRALLDLIVLAALIQIVVWPMRLVTPWSVARTVAIDATLVGWAALIAAIVAAAGGAGAGARSIAMAACVVLAGLGPLVALVANRLGGTPGLVASLTLTSPFTLLRSLTGAGPTGLGVNHAVLALAPSVAACGAWATVALLRLRRPAADRGDRDGEPGGPAGHHDPRSVSSSPLV